MMIRKIRLSLVYFLSKRLTSNRSQGKLMVGKSNNGNSSMFLERASRLVIRIIKFKGPNPRSINNKESNRNKINELGS